jgi:hypothetical protein
MTDSGKSLPRPPTTPTKNVVAVKPVYTNIGGTCDMLLKNGQPCEIIYMGNNGASPKSKATFSPSPLQRRMEHIYADVTKDASRTSALDVVLEVYAESTHAKVTQAMWVNKAKRKAVKVGQDGIFWVKKVAKELPTRDLKPVAGADYWDLFTEYNSIDEADVRAHCNYLRECVFAQEDCEDSAEWLNSSIGPDLHKQVHMNGVDDLPGPLLCYKILKTYSVNNRTKCVSARNKIGVMNIKKDPKLDYNKLYTNLLLELQLIHNTDPDYLKGTEDVGLAIVKALTVEPGWVPKNIDSVLLRKTLVELEEKSELGEKMSFQYLDSKLRHLAEVHKNLKEVGHYAPATRKPKPEEVKTAALIAQVNTLKKDLDALKGNGGDTSGGNSGNTGGKKKFDKTNVECHACKGKGHMKYDKECPKYAETMAKKNQSGSDNGNAGGASNAKSGKNAWKYTKTSDTVERNGQKFYWCPKCNGGKGMYVSSHGPGHPSKPAHDDNFRANRQQQPAGQQNLAIDSVGGEGPSVSFGGVEFYTPAGLLGVIDDASLDEVYPKAWGR